MMPRVFKNYEDGSKLITNSQRLFGHICNSDDDGDLAQDTNCDDDAELPLQQ